MKVDLVASEIQYFDHLWPIAKALGDNLGAVYIRKEISELVPLDTRRIQILEYVNSSNSFLVPYGKNNPIVFSSSNDLQAFVNGEKIYNNGISMRKKILMEHGVGIVYPDTPNQSYAGGRGARDYADLFLAPNEIIQKQNLSTYPNTPSIVIGTPKLDKWFGFEKTEPGFGDGKIPWATISFHWDCKVSPEAGNALPHYRNMLSNLKDFKDVIFTGHGHPRIIDELQTRYKTAGIQTIRDFERIMTGSDLYIVDNSSTLYEFCVTGKPVMILNAPWYRRDIHNGIRFWDYTDIGPQCEHPLDFESSVLEALKYKDVYAPARARVVRDLFPYFGSSADRAAEIVSTFFE